MKKSERRSSHALKGHILTDDEVAAVATYMRKSMGPAFAAICDEYGLSMEDTLRFQPLAFRLAEARAARGLSLKQAADLLKVAKYRLDYIERASIRNVDPALLVRYIEYLGLKHWFGRWKKANAAFAQQIGVSSVKPKRQGSPLGSKQTKSVASAPKI